MKIVHVLNWHMIPESDSESRENENVGFIGIIVGVQLLVWALLALSWVGLDIPLARQVVCFIYLTFVPGMLIMYIMGLRLRASDAIMHAAGLSIALLMFAGFMMNMLYPIIGISRPITLILLTATISVVVLILCAVAFLLREKRTVPFRHESIPWTDLLSPQASFLMMLPMISIIGTYLVNYHQNNLLLVLLLLLIALVPVLAVFGLIDKKLFPLATVAVAVALLWYWSLISSSIYGYDIQHEYFFSNQVMDGGRWDYTQLSNVNAMLSIVILAPIYSLMLNLDAVWVFKVIYPVFLSLGALALFRVYQKQTNSRIALLSIFFFMSMPGFSQMASLARQEIAELFFALSLLLLVGRDIKVGWRIALLVIYSMAIVVSHYGLSYIYMIYLLFSLPLALLLKKFVAREDKAFSGSVLTVTYAVLFIVFCLSWYLYVSSGTPFNVVVNLGKHMATSIGNELLSPDARHEFVLQALGMAPMRSKEIEWEMARFFQYVTQLFIMAGILQMLWTLRKTRFRLDYVAMSLVSMVILFLCIAVPYFSSTLNMERIYHITLFLLAPFCVLGGMMIFSRLRRLIRVDEPSVTVLLGITTLLVLMPYSLFATGFVFYVTGAAQTSMPLTAYDADWMLPTRTESSTCVWVGSHMSNKTAVYADEYGGMMVRYGGMMVGAKRSSVNLQGFPQDPQAIRCSSYVFLRRWNVLSGEARMVELMKSQVRTRYLDLRNESYLRVLSNMSRVYDNGDSMVMGSMGCAE
jgi:uncharacterized membrane protein